MSAPRVSVLMPAYNHERFVAQAVESVWQQTYSNVELLIIDDGSTDRTAEILEALAGNAPISMRIETRPNRGIAQTLNRLIDRAQGEWIAFLASDDFYAPDFLERNLAEAARIGGDDIVLHSNAHLVEPSGRQAGTVGRIAATVPAEGDAFEPLLNRQAHVVASTLFLRRRLLLDVGGFDETMIAEDFDLHLRLARRAPFHYIAEPIFYARHTPGSLGKRPWLWNDSTIRAIAKHEDLLGSRLPDVVSRECESISRICFEQGHVREGLKWARKAVSLAKSSRPRMFARIGMRSALALARAAAVRLFGRERFVLLKRKLQGG